MNGSRWYGRGEEGKYIYIYISIYISIYIYIYILSVIMLHDLCVTVCVCSEGSALFHIRKICWCKLKHMVKYHWQIYMVMLSEQSKLCSCKWRTLTKRFDKLVSCRRGKCDKLFVGLLAFGKDKEYN